jgi:hypothetical protein
VISSSTMNGTPSRNAEPHQKCSSSAPPTSGPSAMPPMKLANHTPSAVAICLGSANMLRINAIVEGIRVAPEMPSRARAMISIVGVVEYAQRIEARPNTAAPISSSRRRPIRSPSVPMVTRNPASMNE